MSATTVLQTPQAKAAYSDLGLGKGYSASILKMDTPSKPPSLDVEAKYFVGIMQVGKYANGLTAQYATKANSAAKFTNG